MKRWYVEGMKELASLHKSETRGSLHGLKGEKLNEKL